MKGLSILALIAIVLYPLGVYVGLRYFDPRVLIILLLLVAGLRWIGPSKSLLNHWLWLPLVGVLAVWTWVGQTDLGLKFYPVLVNVSLLALFAWSLRHPPTVIERFARLQDPNLPAHGVRYTRNVTRIWCVFFAANAAVAAATSLWASDAVWALYNGLLAYLLMGMLFAGEWLVRRRVMESGDE